MKGLHIVSWILLVVGGLNWGLVGAFDLNVVEYLGSTIATIVYVLVGIAAIAAIVEIVTHKKCCSCCVKGSSQSM